VTSQLVDSFGRVHRDLRISLTDRCSLRCTYCMPEQGVPWISRDSILTTDEIVRSVRVAASLGITSVRLTGGEPLLRPDLVDIVAALAAIDGADGPLDVAMTTNGIGLVDRMEALRDAGLRRLNISLDTLRADRFLALTRRDRLDDVLAGIAAAQASGLRPLKLNAVAMRGVNDDELSDLLAFALDHDAELRFIEQMPLDAGHTWSRERLVSADDILHELSLRFALEPVDDDDPSSPASLWQVDGGPACVGVIASVTRPFCAGCDRLRLTADGELRNCLFGHDEYKLTDLLRDGADDAQVAEVFHTCVAGKRAGHGINDVGFLQPIRPMNAIGG
jgi:cyclic pyranopterin phosphate synthase